jgi:glycosyltransferase involved in cell wall biosynthesis
VTGPSRILVLIPAYNEEDSLAHVVGEVRSTLPEVEVLVVNDGSRDGTAAVVEALPAVALHLPYHVGVGAAEQTGFRFALERGYPRVVRTDADGQHRAADIPRLLQALSEEDADVVVGSRFLEGGRTPTPRLRRLGIAILASVVSLVGGKRITDPTSGLRAFGPRAIRLSSETYPALYPEPESLVRFLRAGLRVVEVPVEMNRRYAGQSSIRLVDSAYYMVRVLVSILIEALRSPAKLPPQPGEKGGR